MRLPSIRMLEALGEQLHLEIPYANCQDTLEQTIRRDSCRLREHRHIIYKVANVQSLNQAKQDILISKINVPATC